MPRPATLHICCDCAHASPRWHGRCPGCGAWNTLVEERAPAPSGRGAGGRMGGRTGAPRADRFDVGSSERAQAFLTACELVAEATSFGGVHTSAERRARWGTDAVPGGFIRLSAGVEDIGDLAADLTRALDVAG